MTERRGKVSSKQTQVRFYAEGQDFGTSRGAVAKYVGVKIRKSGGKFDSSRCGGHKNSENAATFSKLLGQEDKLSPAPTASKHARARPVIQMERRR